MGGCFEQMDQEEIGQTTQLLPLSFSDVLLIVLVVVAIYTLVFKRRANKPIQKVEKQTTPEDKHKQFWSKEEIERHNKPNDCWLIVDNKVYDVTEYVEDHVGGVEAISKHAGKDNTAGVFGPQHPERVKDLLEDYFI